MYALGDIVYFMFSRTKEENHIEQYLSETTQILSKLDKLKLQQLVYEFIELRVREGRLFILGNGGSAANASHAVNDFRKMCHIEAYSPSDNIAELTARANDNGFETVYDEWLKTSKLNNQDVILVLSSSGGNLEEKTSFNLIRAIEYAQEIGSKVFSIVGKKNGFAAKNADISVIIPRINPQHTIGHAEELQSIILHMLVNHPLLKLN